MTEKFSDKKIPKPARAQGGGFFWNAGRAAVQPEERIEILRPAEMLRQSSAAKIVAGFFQSLKSPIAAGSTGRQIEQLAVYYLQKHGLAPAMRGYRNFPADISVNVNHVAAHGVPNDAPFADDDVVTVDIAASGGGLYADAAWSYCVGNPSAESRNLIAASWNISRAGACAAEAGAPLSDISRAVQNEARRCGAHVYTQFTGHGIGRAIHQPPGVRYDLGASDTRLTPGMVLCIEPIVSLKPQGMQQNPDGSYAGKKGYKTAVFEHMVGIFSSGTVVMTYGGCAPESIPVLSLSS